MNVNNLKKPIILQFPFDKSKVTALQSSQLSCKYYDETNSAWYTNGCVFSSVNYAKGIVYCACTHTTLFSVVSETSVPTTTVISNSAIVNNLLMPSNHSIRLVDNNPTKYLLLFFVTLLVILMK
jgi:hypothetical protein